MKRLICPNSLPLAVVLIIVAAVGCGRDEVKVYKVDASDAAAAPSPALAAAPMPANMPDGLPVPDNSGQPKLKYTLPAGWKEKALTQLRVASFEVPENGKTADVSVIPLSGAAGGDSANVNRWRGQVGQPPLDEAGLQKLVEPIEITSQPGQLYDIVGTSPGSGDALRILGGILHVDDTTWYFKMMGDADLVQKQKTSFIAFLKTASFDKAAAPASMDLSQLPPSHPPIPGTSIGTQKTLDPNTNTTVLGGMNFDSNDKPAWTVPADWKEGQLAQFLVAKYVISGSGDVVAAVNVSQLSGDGGGLLLNLNRWRAQLGLPPVSEADLAKLPTIDASGVKATVADLTGTDARSGKPARLVGVVLPLNGQTWFYKLMGDAATVGRQKDAFIKFIQSAKYPAGK
ncbi:MAG: hypothetical protein WCH99_15130 [Verrucomicrobiota bacterium]